MFVDTCKRHGRAPHKHTQRKKSEAKKCRGGRKARWPDGAKKGAVWPTGETPDPLFPCREPLPGAPAGSRPCRGPLPHMCRRCARWGVGNSGSNLFLLDLSYNNFGILGTRTLLDTFKDPALFPSMTVLMA